MDHTLSMNIFGNDWTIAWCPGKFIVEKGTGRDFIKKVVNVEDDSEYVYKLMKTKIKARDGAEGLFNFIAGWYRDNFGLSRIETILNYIMDNMREG